MYARVCVRKSRAALSSRQKRSARRRENLNFEEKDPPFHRKTRDRPARAALSSRQTRSAPEEIESAPIARPPKAVRHENDEPHPPSPLAGEGGGEGEARGGELSSF